MKLSDITKRLGQHYADWKLSEAEKNEYKEEFFKAIDAEFTSKEQPTKTIQIYGPSEKEARERMDQYHPTVHIDAMVKADKEGDWVCVVQEDPGYQPYTYVNKEDGWVYTRQVAAGKLHLDEELLLEVDPELYERVTEVPDERQLRPLDQLSADDLAAVQEFIYEGNPTIKLGKPRKAKPEELEDK